MSTEHAIAMLMQRFDSADTRNQERHKELMDRFDGLETTLHGSKEDPSKGVVVRLDRIEQKQANRDKWTFGLGVGVVLALVKSIGAWIDTHVGGS